MNPRARVTRCPRTQRAWALPSALFALAALLSTARLLSLESIDAYQIATEARRGEALKSGMATLLSNPSLSSPECETVTVPDQVTTQIYEVCREVSRPFVTLPSSAALPFGLVDYDAIFSRASPCPGTSSPSSNAATPSPRARTDCVLPPNISGSTVLLENIRGESITLASTDRNEALVLASPGDIITSGELQVSHDLLIVAGGDVELPSIHGTSGSFMRVTIVSSLGAIRVGPVVGDVALLIAGRGLLEAPETQLAGDYPMPPMRSPSLRGFRSLS